MKRASNILGAILNYADSIVVNTGELVERQCSLVLNTIEKVKSTIDNNLEG